MIPQSSKASAEFRHEVAGHPRPGAVSGAGAPCGSGGASG